MLSVLIRNSLLHSFGKWSCAEVGLELIRKRPILSSIEPDHIFIDHRRTLDAL